MPDFSLQNLLNPPVAVLTLQGAPMNLGGTNASGTMGLWQTEWTASGLEEAYYRVHITVTDHTGHAYTDSVLRFSDPIAGNNTPGTTNYPDGGMRRMDAEIDFLFSKRFPDTAVIDATNGYAYFGTRTNPGHVVKVALGAGDASPTRVGEVTLEDGENSLRSAVIDAANGYAYFGTSTSPGRVVKVALGAGNAPPTRVGAVTLDTGENDLSSAVIDTANGYAYFGTYTTPGRVVKVALGAGSNPPTRVGAVTLASGEDLLTCAVIDAANGYAWFGTRTSPGRVVKVALGAGNDPPMRVGAVTLSSSVGVLLSAVIDTANGYAYFGTGYAPFWGGSYAGWVVKVALGAGANPPTWVGSVRMWGGLENLTSAVIDAANGYAYFGISTNTGHVVKVALGAGSNPPTIVTAVEVGGYSATRIPLASAVIDTSNGYAWFGLSTNPGRVVKVALGAGNAPPTLVNELVLRSESNFSSAVIDADNGYAYFGTGSYVVKVALGAGTNPPTRVGAVTLATGENSLASAVIDAANGYAYFGTWTYPGRVVKVALGAGSDPPTRVGAVTLDAGEDSLRSAVIDAANGYAWFGTSTSPSRVVKVALGTGTNPPTRVGAVTLASGEDNLRSAVIDAANGYAYFGTYTSPGRVVKVALGAGANPPTRVGALTLDTGENSLWSAVIDAANGYAYFGTDTSPGRVVKVALGAGDGPPTRVGAVTLEEGENSLRSAVIDAASGYAYFGTGSSPGRVVKVALGAGSAAPTRVGAMALPSGENHLRSAVIDAAKGYAYFGTGTDPGRVVKVALSQQGFVKGTRFTMPEDGTVQSLSFYSHRSSGNLRLGLYGAGAFPALLWESTPIANTAANDWLAVDIGDGTPSSLSLSAGEYWLGWQVDTMADVPSYAAGDPDEGLLVPYSWDAFPASLEAGTATEPTFTNDRWSGYITYELTPVPPSNPGSTAIGLDTITWTWQDNSPDEDGFKVWADPGAAEPTTLRATTLPDVESWAYDGLGVNTAHAFQVAAFNANGDSAKTSNFTAWTLIEPVAGLAFSGVTSSAITVAATSTPSNLSSGASGLYFANTTSGTDSGWQQSATPWVSSGLTPNTLYNFGGESRNGAGVTTIPSTDTCYTLAAAPLAPMVGNATGSSLDVAIGAGDGNPAATEYAVYCATAGLWVQGDGTLNTIPVWQTAAVWARPR